MQVESEFVSSRRVCYTIMPIETYLDNPVDASAWAWNTIARRIGFM